MELSDRAAFALMCALFISIFTLSGAVAYRDFDARVATSGDFQ